MSEHRCQQHIACWKRLVISLAEIEMGGTFGIAGADQKVYPLTRLTTALTTS